MVLPHSITLHVQSTSTGIIADPHNMPYRGPMYSDSSSELDSPVVGKGFRKRGHKLGSSSDSDIPVIGKGFRKRGHKFDRDTNTSSDDSDFQKKRRKLSTKDRHCRKWCPVSGCQAGPQGRLAWHIKVYHPSISGKLRRHLTRTAAKVKKPAATIARPEGTPTLPTLLARMAREDTKSPRETQHLHVQQVRSTRSFPRFALDHPMIAKFIEFLRGLAKW